MILYILFALLIIVSYFVHKNYQKDIYVNGHLQYAKFKHGHYYRVRLKDAYDVYEGLALYEDTGHTQAFHPQDGASFILDGKTTVEVLKDD